MSPPLAAIPSKQLAVVLELLGITNLPFPLAVPAVLTTHAERARVRDGLKNDLVLRDRVRDRIRVRDEIEDAFRLLEAPKTMVAVTGADHDGTSWGGVAAARANYALLAEQDGEELRLRRLQRRSLAGTTAAMLPYANPGSGPELHYPVTGGRPTRDYERAEKLLAGRIRAGTITIRGYGDDHVLTWFDCSDGRYCAWTDGGWTTINPAGTEHIATHLSGTLGRHTY